MKKISLITLILFTAYIYRLEFYNAVIEYCPKRQHQIYELTNSYWTNEIDKVISSDSYVGIVELDELVSKLITKRLRIGMGQKQNDPNLLTNSSIADSKDYVALNASILNYAIKKLNSEIYVTYHLEGQISLFGCYLSSMDDSLFAKKHHFVKIENKLTGRYYFSDAFVYEYLRTNRIKLKNGM